MKLLPHPLPSFRFGIPLTFLALSLLAGCSKTSDAPASAGAPKTAPKAGAVKIGFYVKQPEEPWFQLEWRFAEKAAQDFGFTLLKAGANDPEKVLAAIDSFAANGAQGFIICTPDTKLGSAVVNKARAANLKIISVDDQFVGANGQPMKNVHHVGISAYKIGEIVGQRLAAEMKQRGWTPADTAACVITFDELATAKERTDGEMAALLASGFPRERIYRAPQRTTDIPGSFDAMNVVLTQHPNVKHWLVCSMNDTGSLGAVRALEGRGFSADNAIAIGINGTDCIVELEKDKPTAFFGSVLLSAKDHGYRTAELMYKWITAGTEPPLDTRTLGVFITRENFRQVLKEQGVRE